MNDVLLFGIGSPVIADVEESLERAGLTVIAGVNNRAVPSELSANSPVVQADEISAHLRSVPFLVPLFSPGNRRIAVDEARALGLTTPFTLSDPTAILPKRIEIGPGSFINAGCVLGSRLRMGAFCFLNRGAIVGHDVRLGDFVSIGPGAVIGGNATIEAGVLVGTGAIILPKVSVGENAVIGAGAVVTRDVPAGITVAGNPAQPSSPREGARPKKRTTKSVVHLYSLCWNEKDMLGFFFREYDPWIDRYIIYDDGSTDGSLDVLRSHPRVELRSFARTDPNSFVRSHTLLQNEIWKESRGNADWVVITAIDEHLWVPGAPMKSYLAQQRQQGVTSIPALGFDMIDRNMPNDEGRLVELVRSGQPSGKFNKLSIFNPTALEETNYDMGRHKARPSGTIKLPTRDELMLWHFKHIGFDRTAAREKAQGERLGSKDIANKWGFEYLWSQEEFETDWTAREQHSVILHPQISRYAEE